MPTNNPYAARLEEQRRDLLRRRRNIKEFIEKSWFLVSDNIDRANAVRNAQREFAYLGRQYEQICHELGRDPWPPTVKIPPAEVSRRQIAELQAARRTRVAPAKRTLPTGYVTRMIGHWGCR